MASRHDVTALLGEWRRGNRDALDELVPHVYAELRRIADRQFRMERVNHTLQPTALINEVYLRLVDQRQVDWQNRAHFFGVAAQSIRHILVDHARGHKAAKRGAGAAKLSLDEAIGVPEKREVDVLALDESLERLAILDPQQGQIVELRFFGGFSVEETADALDVSTRTVINDWNTARAWLRRRLTIRPTQ